ncbi:lipocalin-like domain-containing protein [Croceivirga radicis]|uniref:Lipocalin-like domain-containing protein n=1 Tax=Croceivirga radicis TaxID=1929488 RepID=A0A1V6LT63_9FLAO|nr:lipocalin family protein [Croceivirga radicis]OQD43237.1 hypothetical protein BUL40_05210 [Croceivirga radicis]
MKARKYIGMAIFALLVVSCSVSKSSRQQQNILSGSWILNNVSYEGTDGMFKSVLFNDSQAICFEGSQWFFRDNNNTGRYTIQGGSLCQGGDRFIKWTIVEPTNSVSQLQFKFIDEKNKDISGGLGYRLDIANLTENQMTLKSRVNAGGEMVTLVYNFTKQL